MQTLLSLHQILGHAGVTPEQAARNRAARDAARADGKRVSPRPMRPRAGVPGVLPISKSTWWAGIAEGRFPKPVSVGRRSLWRASDIQELLERLGRGE